jgi:hypothetical protein
MTKREGADKTIRWTRERILLSARADFMIRQIARWKPAPNGTKQPTGTLTSEEALLLTLFPPKDERLDALVEKEAETIGLGRIQAKRDVEANASKSEAERVRYHNDPACRERRLATMRSRKDKPGFREKDAERKRRARAAARAAS